MAPLSLYPGKVKGEAVYDIPYGSLITKDYTSTTFNP
jgi:hypothetical protein